MVDSHYGARSAQWTISSEFTPFQIRADILLQLNDVWESDKKLVNWEGGQESEETTYNKLPLANTVFL